MLIGFCVLPFAANAQIYFGNQAINNAQLGSDIADSLTAGYPVNWVSGEIYNAYGYSVSVSYSFKIDGTTVASDSVTWPAGLDSTVYEPTSPVVGLAAGSHTLQFIVNGTTSTRNFTVFSAPIVTFDAQGGTTPVPASKTVTNYLPYGTLATTARTGYNFAGWWTGAGGTGTQVTSATIVATTASHTLYAKWTAAAPVLNFVSATLSGGNGDQNVDASECNDVMVLIRNDGNGTASSITGTLTTTTSGITVIQPSSVYPDVSVGATVTNTTAFRISASPWFACGTPVSLTLLLNYAQGSTNRNFNLASGGSCSWTGLVHVNRAYLGIFTNGSICAPFKSVTSAYQAAQNTNTLLIFATNYNEVILMNKRLLLRATNGVVRIGTP